MAALSASMPVELRDALRESFAVVVCLTLAEWIHLQFAYLALMTVHMVMNQYAHTAFQKGLERVVGRAIGIGYGLILCTFFRETPVLEIALELLGLAACFYVYFSGWLAYTFLNCGLYTAAIVQIGHAEPATVYPAAADMLISIVLGVFIADLANWLTGAEKAIDIQPGGAALWPLRTDWLNHSLQLTTSVAVISVVAVIIKLPATQIVVAVMMLMITSDQQALMRKSGQRIAGAVLAGSWGLMSFFILSHLPHFPILIMLVFLGMFLASYYCRTSQKNSYVGLQMGLVIPMVLIVPASEFGSIGTALIRLVAVAVGLAASVLVLELWPCLPAPAAGQ